MVAEAVEVRQLIEAAGDDGGDWGGKDAAVVDGREGCDAVGDIGGEG